MAERPGKHIDDEGIDEETYEIILKKKIKATMGTCPKCSTKVYAFRKASLLAFTQWPMGILENIEKLEQLRYLENGIRIKMIETSFTGIGIDTPEDLEKAKALLSLL